MKEKIVVLIFLLLMHIGFMIPVNARVLMGAVSDSSGVIGLEMNIGHEPIPIVSYVYPKGPSKQAGLLSGDRIIMINNITTYGMNINEVDQAISDQPGSIVKMIILRKQKQMAFEVKVVALEDTSNDLQKDYLNY